jgi:DNA-directed RNA polymerase specialized sigma24 family protein
VRRKGFIAAYRRLHTFHAGSFKSWLFRIAVNKCYDVLRAQRRRSSVSLNELTDDHDES